MQQNYTNLIQLIDRNYSAVAFSISPVYARARASCRSCTALNCTAQFPETSTSVLCVQTVLLLPSQSKTAKMLTSVVQVAMHSNCSQSECTSAWRDGVEILGTDPKQLDVLPSLFPFCLLSSSAPVMLMRDGVLILSWMPSRPSAVRPARRLPLSEQSEQVLSLLYALYWDH